MGEEFLADGVIQPVLELPLKRPAKPDGRWSSRPGCYQLKSALAWHDLSVPTGNKKYLSHYRFALEQAASEHQAFLPGDDDERRVVDRLHAYCCFLEGLLPVASKAERGEVLHDEPARLELVVPTARVVDGDGGRRGGSLLPLRAVHVECAQRQPVALGVV